jgi:tetrahydromethanopterin S-methyltransferase subunit G
MMLKHTEICSEHQGIAISCSKIEDMHNVINKIDHKIDVITAEMNIMTTQKNERWKVQGWLNKLIIGLMITLIITIKYYGGK